MLLGGKKCILTSHLKSKLNKIKFHLEEELFKNLFHYSVPLSFPCISIVVNLTLKFYKNLLRKFF